MEGLAIDVLLAKCKLSLWIQMLKCSDIQMFSSVFFKELKELEACGNEETGKFFVEREHL